MKFAILALLGLVGSKHQHKKHRLVQFAVGDYGFDDLGEEIRMHQKPYQLSQQ